MSKIEVPKHDVNAAIKHGILKAQKEKPSSKIKKRIKIPIIAAALAVSCLGLGFVFPKMKTVLADVPIIGSLYSQYDTVGKNLEKKNLVTKVNQRVVNNGIGMTVQNVYFDGARMSIIIKVDDPKLDLKNFVFKDKIADGSDKWFSEGGAEMTPQGIVFDLQFNYPEKELPKNMLLPLTITSGDIPEKTKKSMPHLIEGQWDFKIPIPKLPSKKIDVAKSVISKDQEHKFQMESITLGNETAALDYKAIHSLIGKDDLTRIDRITDDKGQEVHLLSSGTEFGKKQVGNKIVSEERSNFSKIPEDTKYITIYPYVRETDILGIHSLNAPTPFAMKGKRSGLKLLVNDIQYKKKDNELVVLFRIVGASKGYTAEDLQNFIENICLEDSSMAGKTNIPVGHLLKGNHAEIINAKKFEYRSTFQLDGENGYTDYGLTNFTLKGYSLAVPFTQALPEKKLPPLKVDLK